MPGSTACIVDTLSRTINKVKDDPEIFSMVHSISKPLFMLEIWFHQFQKTTEKDDKLKFFHYVFKRIGLKTGRDLKILIHQLTVM